MAGGVVAAVVLKRTSVMEQSTAHDFQQDASSLSMMDTGTPVHPD